MDEFSGLKPVKHPLSNGGQGTVEVVEDANGQRLIRKSMAAKPATEKRTAELVNIGKQISSPYIAKPSAWRKTKDGKIESLAPFVEGCDLELDPPRPLTELLEIAQHCVSQMVILESVGLAHGDIAPANILVSPDGATNWIDLDGANLPGSAMPPPETLGQRPMLAPELRDGSQAPNMASDRYAIGVYLNMLLLGRHPIDGLANTPTETDDWMSRNLWPERHRSPYAGETPIEALGDELMDLFDRAFSTSPNVRPSAKEWQLELTHALDNTWIHDCGGVFVCNDAQTLTCPHCGEIGARPPENPLSASGNAAGPQIEVRLTVPDHGVDEKLVITPPQVLTLGRDTIPNLPQTVSGKHLNLAWIRHQLTVQHIGRNESLVNIDGTYLPFSFVNLRRGEVAELKLAGTAARLKVTD